MGTQVDHDFEMTPPAPATADPPRPAVLVVRHRERNLSAVIWPPVVVLLVALVIMSYQPPATEDVDGPPLPSPAFRTHSPPPPPAKTESIASVSPLAEPGPVVVRQETPPPPEPSVIDEPPAPSPPPAIEVARTEPPAPETLPDDLPVVPEPAVTKAKVDEEIRAEASRRQAEREHLERSKQPLHDQGVMEAQRHQAEVVAKKQANIETERKFFLDELGKLIRSRGDRAAPGIVALCSRYDHEPLPEIATKANLFLKDKAATLSREERIRIFRAYGLPEPSILDFLHLEDLKFLKRRGGPRTEDDTWIRSARRLLAVPLPANGRP